jgi:ribosome recycling factor
LIPAIEKAIKEENLGLNPQNDGILIRITLPILTEDRRKQLVKQAKEMGEEAKVAIRNIRRDQNEALKKLGKGDGIAEDAIKATEAEVQKITDAQIKQVDEVMKNKEAEIMKV